MNTAQRFDTVNQGQWIARDLARETYFQASVNHCFVMQESNLSMIETMLVC